MLIIIAIIFYRILLIFAKYCTPCYVHMDILSVRKTV